MIQRSFRYRLYPAEDQAERMAQIAGAVRFVYNLALEQRRDYWRQARAHGHFFNRTTQGREITELRREVDWLADVGAPPLNYALTDLDRAFASFWRGGGFPKFRSKHRHCAFRVKGYELHFQELSDRWTLIRIPKVGYVKMRLSRAWRGRVVSATVSRDAIGWHVALSCEIEHETPDNTLPAVGIDRGVANTLALSTGELLSAPDLARLEKRQKRAQRALLRRKRGSNRRNKQLRRLRRAIGNVTRRRADWRQRTTTGLVRRFGLIALEDLPVLNMVSAGRGKSGLNRRIQEQGWSDIARLLAYKLDERGGTLKKVNPAYSSQTCAVCGAVDKASRESQSRFACRHCGSADHADTNAAKVILRRSTAVVEERGYAPVEARSRIAAC